MKLRIIFFFFTLCLIGLSAVPVFGAEQEIVKPSLRTEVFNNIKTSGGSVYQNVDALTIIIAVVRAVLGVLGVVFLILIVYGGFLWMMAHGDDKQIGKAQQMLWQSTIGLVIVLAAYSISVFVVGALKTAAL